MIAFAPDRVRAQLAWETSGLIAEHSLHQPRGWPCGCRELCHGLWPAPSRPIDLMVTGGRPASAANSSTASWSSIRRGTGCWFSRILHQGQYDYGAECIGGPTAGAAMCGPPAAPRRRCESA